VISRFRRFHPRGLPIFSAEVEKEVLLYAPGHVSVMSRQQAKWVLEHYTDNYCQSVASEYIEFARALETIASKAVRELHQQSVSPYSPECLTIYLSNQCNLACPYCFSKEGAPKGNSPKTSARSTVINEKVVKSAARIVARYCRERKRRFHLVLHGGGEPTQHPQAINRILSVIRRITTEFGLELFAYIATNGVMETSQVHFIAREFNVVGISCDGPPDIQDMQRPLIGGGRSSPIVERTIHTLAEANGQFVIRSTITPESVPRQKEIVSYLCQHLGASQLRFEPVYRQRGDVRSGFGPDQAAHLAQHFLCAQLRAKELGCELTFSGVRIDEVHGPYCNVLRDVLCLTPEGTATACFLCSNVWNSDSSSFRIGGMDESTSDFVLNTERIAALRLRAGKIPVRCKDCVNAYHCARGCPDECILTAHFNSEKTNSRVASKDAADFRCRVQRFLSEAWILQLANPLRNETRLVAGSPCIEVRVGDMPKLNMLLREAAPYVDIDAILREWDAVRTKMSIERAKLPLPVWGQRGFDHNGERAWQQLSRHVGCENNHGAMSIYIHVPFCDRRCGFCNSLARALGRDRQRYEEEFSGVLEREIENWAELRPLDQRPISTIHSGGGTPNLLSETIFAGILEHCRDRFNVISQTEWALESTSSLLSDEHLGYLKQCGFTRLHVGVQTLEDRVRKVIGRRETSSKVIEKLNRALRFDFVVSVDVMYGLPGQTMTGFLKTLQRLTEIGIKGFSLYGLHITHLNRRFLQHHGAAERDMLRDYIFAHVGEQYLIRNGYSKTHFTHFALLEDSNLYYSFPQRGEDLLALGPTADGVFGHYHYRHLDYEDYVAPAPDHYPVLEGGVLETIAERRIRPAATELMGGKLGGATVRDLGAEALLSRWLDCCLLKESADQTHLVLTANGSWFVDDMLKQLAQHLAGEKRGK